MPRFEITSPDGRRFEITAPEGATQDQVLAYAQANFGAPPAPSQMAVADNAQYANAATQQPAPNFGRGPTALTDTDIQGMQANVSRPPVQQAPQYPANSVFNDQMKADDISPLHDLLNIGKRGLLQSKQTENSLALSMGLIDPATFAERNRETQRRIEAAAPSQNIQEGIERLGKSSDTGNYWDVIKEIAKPKNLPALASIVGESAVSTAPQIPLSVLGSLIGGPVGMAASTGAGSFGMEFGSAIGDLLDKKGIDPTDANAVREAVSDPAFMAEAKERGLKRGIPIAALDALSAGFAGRFIGNFKKAVENQAIKGSITKAGAIAASKEAGLQIGAGMAGEAIGQALTGENKPLDVLVEGLAELPGGAVEVASNVRAAKKSANNVNAPAAETPVTPTTSTPAPPAPGGTAADEDAQNMLDELSGKPPKQKPIDPEELQNQIEEHGIPINNRVDANKLFSNGNPIYAFHELDEEPVLVTSQDMLDNYTPDQLVALPKENANVEPIAPPEQTNAPKPTVNKDNPIQTFDAGNNTEARVFPNDKGYIANFYDKDSGNYIGGKIFPTKNFGDQALPKALEFAQSEADKSKKMAGETTETQQVAPTPPIQPEASVAKGENAQDTDEMRRELGLLPEKKAEEPKTEIKPEEVHGKVHDFMDTLVKNIVSSPEFDGKQSSKELKNYISESLLKDIQENNGKLSNQMIEEVAQNNFVTPDQIANFGALAEKYPDQVKLALTPKEVTALTYPQYLDLIHKKPPYPDTTTKPEQLAGGSNFSKDFIDTKNASEEAGKKYTKAMNLVRDNVITQKLYDQIKKDAEDKKDALNKSLKKEYPNFSNEHKEVYDLAQQAKELGNSGAKGANGFADGMIGNILKNVSVGKDRIDFFKEKINDFKAQVGTKGSAPVSETRNLDILFSEYPLDKKRLEKFGNNPEVKPVVDQANHYLQKLTNAINEKGFRINDVDNYSPKDVKELNSIYKKIHAGISRLLLNAQHVAGKEARKNNLTKAEQDKQIEFIRNKFQEDLKENLNHIDEAKKILGETKAEEAQQPKPEHPATEKKPITVLSEKRIKDKKQKAEEKPVKEEYKTLEEVQSEDRQGVEHYLNRFKNGEFSEEPDIVGTGGAEGRAIAERHNKTKEQQYALAIKEFLEGPLDTRPPSKKQKTLEMEEVTEVSPRPIKKSVGKIADNFDEVRKAMHTIAGHADPRLYLNGLHINEKDKNLVATDGHRLALLKDIKPENLPEKPEDLPVASSLTKDNVWKIGYPDYSKVIPKSHGDTVVEINSKEMEKIAEIARGIAKAGKYLTYQIGEMPITIGDTTLNFNAKYIADAMDLTRKLGFQKAELSFSAKGNVGQDKLFLTSLDGKLQQVVMPVNRPRNNFKALELGEIQKPEKVKVEPVVKHIDEEQPKVNEKPKEMDALNDKIKDVVDQKIHQFEVGDHVRFGSTPGMVVGVMGDYIKFRPDNAKSPKAYQNVLAKNVTFESRPPKDITTSASKASDKQVGTEKGELKADMGGLIKLLGANMYAANIGDVAVKELLQNAFDASKAAVKLGIVKEGKIDIKLNRSDRTITVTDNARGMTPSIVKDAFFTVAGSDKSDLDPKERSGGLGLAKMGFMLGSEKLKLDTVRDGIRTTVNTDSQAIADSNFNIEKTKAPKDEHGTTVTVKIPEFYTDPKTGEQKAIWFPYSKNSIDALTKPLIGPVEINVDFDGTKETLPVGVNFDNKKMPKLTTVHFSWGDADVYFGVDRKDSNGYVNRSKHQVLSSGVYQFQHEFALSQSEVIPYDIIVNVKPDVEAKHPDYPFENSRERFKGRISDDIKSLESYLQKVARGHEAQGLQENFKGIVSMPRVEAGSDIAEASKKLKKAFDKRTGEGEKSFELPEMPKEIFIREGFVKDLKGGILAKPKDNKKESTFTSEKEAPEAADFMLEMKQDPKLPVFINNTSVDYLEIGRPYGNPEQFFAELGTLMVEMKEELSKSNKHFYDQLKPENLFFGGIAIDKKYGGIHIKVPYKGIFINPFYDFGQKSLFGVRETLLNTMIHEIAHTGDMDHGVGHNTQMIQVANYLADNGLLDYFRDAVLDVLVRHESAFTAMREAYGKSTTQNVAKSLEDYGKSSASKAPGTAKGVGVNQPATVSAGKGQGGGSTVSAAPGGAQQGQVNQGSGSPPVNRTRNYKGQPAPASSFDSPDETKMDSFLRAIQDKHIDTKRIIEAIQKTGKQISENWNAYTKEELYHGRTANQVKNFLDKELLPIVKEMAKDNITIDEVDEYLHNRHAKERNDEIAKINPSFPDGGSGLTNQEVDDYFNNLDPKKKTQFVNIVNKIDSIIRGTQDVLVNGGLETQDIINQWNNTYQHYVPLHRSEEELDFVHHGSGLGQGYSTKGSASKRAVGSAKTVVNIFENIALQRERAIIRSEKAIVGKALYGMALQFPNVNFWLPVNPDAIKNKQKLYAELTNLGMNPAVAANIIQEPKVATIDPMTGLVRYQVNPALRNSDNVFPVRINGKDRYVFFNNKDERAQHIAQAMKNLDTEKLGTALGIVGNATRWMASVNTQYNPVFGAWNFTRDTTGAAFNLTTTPIADKKTEVMKGVFPALFAIYGDLRGKNQSTGWSNMNKRFLEAGGATGYSEQFSRGKSKITGERDKSIIEKELQNLNHGNVRKAAQHVFQWLSDYNNAMENAVRLSTFKVGVENGMSDDAAASMAKNITVNFNRKGAVSPSYQALFAFFNASVQGSARLVQTLAGPAGRKIIAGGLALGVAQAIALAIAGYDDDEPPEYLKDKNLIIPMPNGRYLVAPLPLGLNILPGFGRISTEYMLGKMGFTTGAKNIGHKAGQMLGLVVDTFNPLGGNSLWQSITPTVADPIMSIATNKDAFGRPISKEDRSTNPTPGYTRSREGANFIAQGLAEFLNWSSGGTKDIKGALSPTADQLSYLAGQYTGGVGREVMKVLDTGKSLYTGEELPSYKVPIVGKLYGETESPSAIQDKFYKNVVIMSEHEQSIKGMQKRKEHEALSEYRKENPDARYWAQANEIENQISFLNKVRKNLIEHGASQERLEKNRDQKTRIMKRFNDKVRAIQRQQAPAETEDQ